ncbi:hypothetical protein RND71_015505 [Anisodus tanguticus]|uniref:Uncharacterized protein n=1 Tax=Anisodus tanguticus TaxID=243964 RepID=A0AAE1VCX8_9SOLA|nr:hypothetical protein RND71_015505 [Anisodus tanguticus]
MATYKIFHKVELFIRICWCNWLQMQSGECSVVAPHFNPWKFSTFEAINSTESSGGRDYYYNNNQLQHLSDSRLMDKGYTTTSTTNNPTHTNNYPYKSGGKSYYYNNQEQSSNKYSYDANTEKYVRDPYENSREFANSYNANNELSNYNNKFVNYENEEEFQDEEHLP